MIRKEAHKALKNKQKEFTASYKHLYKDCLSYTDPSVYLNLSKEERIQRKKLARLAFEQIMNNLEELDRLSDLTSDHND